MEQVAQSKKTFALHGWIGLGLTTIFWSVNWLFGGSRSQWAFFPLWLGYCLTVDALVYWRRNTSLLTRDWRKYVGLFIISAPSWWIFEAINSRLKNWNYIGTQGFTSLEYGLLATFSFSTVMPAVFGTAELAASFGFIQRLRRGLVVRPDRGTTASFFILGLVMFGLMMAWPRLFFPFIWLSLYFILEPVNIWLGNRHLTLWTQNGDWRPVIVLWIGVLITALFWEMWNYYSYPKWVYSVPWGGFWHIFEMPLLGYLGYLPFSLELFALYHLVVRLLGQKKSDYVQVVMDQQPHQ